MKNLMRRQFLKVSAGSIFSVLCLLLVMGCDSDIETRAPMGGEIVEVQKEDTSWGCIATDYLTIVRAENGRLAEWCGRWGKTGDKVQGVWVEHSKDKCLNGFHR